MSIKKKLLKSKPICKTTFKISEELANGAKKASLVGEFNDWDSTANPMKALKSGGFSLQIDLEKDKEFQFRYLLDGETWVNDDEADAYVASEYGNKNCVVTTA